MQSNRPLRRRRTWVALAAALAWAGPARAQDYVASVNCRTSQVTVVRIEIHCELACFVTGPCAGLIQTFNVPNGPLSCNTPNAFGRNVMLRNVHQCPPPCARFAHVTYTCNNTGGAQYTVCLAVPTPGSGTRSTVGMTCPSGLTEGFVEDAEFSLAEALTLSGPGSPIPPGPGSGGSGAPVWPTVMPDGASTAISLLTIPVPPEATRIVEVAVHGLTHTYAGDLQFVLTDPYLNSYDITSRLGFTGTGFGSSCDLAGDYAWMDTGSAWPLGACGTAIPMGTYALNFGSGAGTWPDGTNAIFNRQLDDIAAVPGPWKLAIIDWASGDVGSFFDWSLTVAIDGAPTSYCVPSVTTNGCRPSISASANPSVAFTNPCSITVSSVEGAKTGLIFYGLSGPANAPWCAPGTPGTLCVRSPVQRTPGQSSGGSAGACDGSLVLDWNAYQASHPFAFGQPWSVGAKVFVQGWFRDPPSCKTTNLSDAALMTYAP